MTAIIIVLCIFVVLLICRIFSMKKQIRDMNRHMEELSLGDTEKKIDISLIDKDISLLASEINKILDRERQLKINLLRKENHLKDSISNISHDLRTPLTTITGYLQILQNADLASEQKDEVEIALRKAIQLQGLITSFFELSVIDSDDIQPIFSTINYSNLLMDVIAENAVMFENRGINPTVTLPQESVIVSADIDMLRRILQNLFSNAIKYACGDIYITLGNDTKAVLTIGNSVPNPHDINPLRIFDRFYTSDISRSDGSTGIGLSIVKILVEKMGGEVNATLNADFLEIMIRL